MSDTRYFTIDQLRAIARARWERETETRTQEDVTAEINDHRESLGKDRVTRQAILQAVRDDSAALYGQLVADVAEALDPGLQVERQSTEATLYMKCEESLNT